MKILFQCCLFWLESFVSFLLTYYASKWYGRKMMPIAGGRHIKIIDRLVVSKTGSILIVDILGKQYLIGVSEQNIQILTEMDESIPPSVEKDKSLVQLNYEAEEC